MGRAGQRRWALTAAQASYLTGLEDHGPARPSVTVARRLRRRGGPPWRRLPVVDGGEPAQRGLRRQPAWRSPVTVFRTATAGGEVQVVMVAARRDQRTTSVVRGCRAAVQRASSAATASGAASAASPPIDGRVLECLARALAEVGRHGVGGVAEQRDPAAVEGRQRRGQFGDVAAVSRPAAWPPRAIAGSARATSRRPRQRARPARRRRARPAARARRHNSRPARRTAASRRRQCRGPSSRPSGPARSPGR